MARTVANCNAGRGSFFAPSCKGKMVRTTFCTDCQGVGCAYRNGGINPALAQKRWYGMMFASYLVKGTTMLGKLKRLFVIKTSWEAYLIIYALALGAVERGSIYLVQYPGFGGILLFLACTGAVFLAGAKILDCLRLERAQQVTIAAAAAGPAAAP